MFASLRPLALALCFCALAYGLAWTYSHLLPHPRWIWAAVLNTAFALVFWKASKPLVPWSVPRWVAWGTWTLGPAILALCAGLCLLSQALNPQEVLGVESVSLVEGVALVLWVPLVEELLFRRDIGRCMEGHLGWAWGAYTSALVFAIAHASPPQAWQPPIGPFLLGLTCHAAYRASGSLIPAILIHAACNATPMLFAAWDPRWQEWLGILYLNFG